jgi:hypothetical protein
MIHNRMQNIKIDVGIKISKALHRVPCPLQTYLWILIEEGVEGSGPDAGLFRELSLHLPAKTKENHESPAHD